ncbi:MAG TPA: hypothetical protein VNA69_17370 [Thermoanaerobaculia bacterium]|nr:hypothetical protein [Thermoanaerobaculia bacterium]
MTGWRYLYDVRRGKCSHHLVELWKRTKKTFHNLDIRRSIPFEPQHAGFSSKERHPLEMPRLQPPVSRKDDPVSFRDFGYPHPIRSPIGEHLIVHVNQPAALMKGVGKLADHVCGIKKVREPWQIKLRQL